jgi:hypothetical protein
VPNATDFDRLLRRLDGGIAPLVRALGFRPVPHDAASANGHARVAGIRDGARAWALDLNGSDDRTEVVRATREVRDGDVAHHGLVIGVGQRNAYFATWDLEGAVRMLVIDRTAPRRADLDALEELVAAPNEGASGLALRYSRSLDRTKVTRRFFHEFRDCRAAIAAAWRGLPRASRAERDQLALLFLCRLMFLHFLQRRMHLAGDPRFLAGLLHAWRRKPGRGTFFGGVLVPLFFGALNRRPEDRTPAARALGELPYLNGGLFERHALERRFPRLDLPDAAVIRAFDGLLERYRFTSAEPADDAQHEVAIDPEMLGRVFEGLMAPPKRSETGTFFTPAAVVSRLVADALVAHLAGDVSAEACRALADGRADRLSSAQRQAVRRRLANIRVLDPACGSGAFLLGALVRIARMRHALEGGALARVRRDVVGASLHGVDVQADAALLCALRLWLALAVEEPMGPDEVEPLPNLDRRIRQGDALLDPLDLAGPGAPPDPAVRRRLRELRPLAGRYLDAEPAARETLRDTLAEHERALACAWIDALRHRLVRSERELRAAAAERDLFGEPTSAARSADTRSREIARRRAELDRLAEDLEDGGAVPFFSFPIHFSEATSRGFDIVVSNPPWVRAHRWPPALARIIRSRYAVCRSPGWKAGAKLAGAPAAAAAQIDLALLFLERSLSLLAPGGTLAFLLPAKTLRSLFGGSARRMLLSDTRIHAIDDHGLDQRSVFQADAFAASIIARKEAALPADAVRIRLIRRNVDPLEFAVPQEDLSLVPGDIESPWLLVPPEVGKVLRFMQRRGTPIGRIPGMRVRRGAFTGANHILLIREARPRLGDLAEIRAEGFSRSDEPSSDRGFREYQAIVESRYVRPAVRGADIEAWRFCSPRSVVWVHGKDGAPQPAPARLCRYLARHEAALGRRSGARPGSHPGALFRVTRDTLAPKVAWQDLADTLNAVALPGDVRSPLGHTGPLVPLNTVYFVPCVGVDRAQLIAAYLNSLPLRTFARAIAERAKDARFRFFAWVVAFLPLPHGWDSGAGAVELARLAAAAHREEHLGADDQQRLDGLVARQFRLSGSQLDALHDFDRWLRGIP